MRRPRDCSSHFVSVARVTVIVAGTTLSIAWVTVAVSVTATAVTVPVPAAMTVAMAGTGVCGVFTRQCDSC